MVTFIEKNPNLRFTTITCGDITLEVRLLNLDGKDVVIFFTNKDQGAIVHSDSTDPKYKFGKNATFNEDDFDL